MRCLCQNEMITIKIMNNEYEQCGKCGLLLKKRHPSSKEEKERYDHHIVDSSYLNYIQKTYKKIESYIKIGETLDFGCGKIKALEKTMKEEGRNCDSYDLYYFPNLLFKKYDTIILIEVFEHLKDLKHDLSFLFHLLKSKGRIIIITQPYEEEYLNDWWYLRDSTHVTFIKKNTFTFWKWNLKLVEQKGNIFILDRI